MKGVWHVQAAFKIDFMRVWVKLVVRASADCTPVTEAGFSFRVNFQRHTVDVNRERDRGTISTYVSTAKKHNEKTLPRQDLRSPNRESDWLNSTCQFEKLNQVPAEIDQNTAQPINLPRVP